VSLVGPGGLLGELTKRVLELGLELEMAELRGYDKHDPAGRDGDNSRYGTRAKTVIMDVSTVSIEVPRTTSPTVPTTTAPRTQGDRADGGDEEAGPVRSL
jgi:putative transposase